MRVLIDTNVALNYFSGREDKYSVESEKIMLMCAEEKIDGVIAFHSLSTFWYVTRKVPEATRREWLRQICELLTISWADNDAVKAAVENSNFPDFEDALQDCCAVTVEADYIITVNTKDFAGHSKTPAVTPAEFLLIFEGENLIS